MHDIDRTQLEDFEGLEPEEFNFESAGEEEGIFGESDTEAGVLDEGEQLEFAANLLEISDEGELDHFLGGLIKRVGQAAGRFIKSPAGRMLGGYLKTVAKRALPIAGRALGGAFGGPAGALIGGHLASGAGKLFGLEVEGLSAEDQQYEVSRQFIRFASDAARRVAMAPATASPQAVAKAAITQAARRYAPGLLGRGAVYTAPFIGGPGQSGRWIRRGRKIILFGV